ncbi:MAG: Hsp20/alpha crystallin family protein, partial [Planctomycetota bacterium]
KGKKFHRVERYYGSFTRCFTLPDNADETKISASFKDGVLNLQIQKTEEVEPKSIEVKVE